MFAELKRKEIDYERRRNKRVQYFESVRTAQTVQIEDIPLPDMCEKPPTQGGPGLDGATIQLPPNIQPSLNSAPSNFQPPGIHIQIPASIQSAIAAHQKAQAEEKSEPKQKDPPGCPPGPPPDLLEMRELDSDYESEDSDRGRRSPVLAKRSRRRYSSEHSSNHSEERHSEGDDATIDVPKPTSVQQRMLAIAGQKYDDFMKELESVHSQQAERAGNEERAQASKRNDHKRSDDDSRSNDEPARNNRDNNGGPNSQSNDPSAHGMKGSAIDDTPNAGLRKENPAAIPNISSIPAPPMPPMMHKMPRPPPPPMGMCETF